MVWAQKCTSVLAVGVPYKKCAAALGSACLFQQSSFEDAALALRSGNFAVVVIDPTGREQDAHQLAQLARAIRPSTRLIYTSRQSLQTTSWVGESMIAANGRQFIRNLRTTLGC